MKFQKHQQTLATILCLTTFIRSENGYANPSDDLEENGKRSVMIYHPKTMTMTKEEHQFKLTGIALFSGTDPVSYTIRALTQSKFSHVGVILSDVEDENKWYCFESKGAKREVMDLKYPFVRTSSWKEVVDDYEGGVSYRLFVYPSDKTINPDLVTDFVQRYNGKSYTKNPLKLVGALLGENHQCKSDDLKTVFCSEMSSKMLMDLEVIKRGVASNYIPKDFTSKRDSFLNSSIPLTLEFKAK